MEDQGGSGTKRRIYSCLVCLSVCLSVCLCYCTVVLTPAPCATHRSQGQGQGHGQGGAGGGGGGGGVKTVKRSLHELAAEDAPVDYETRFVTLKWAKGSYKAPVRVCVTFSFTSFV